MLVRIQAVTPALQVLCDQFCHRHGFAVEKDARDDSVIDLLLFESQSHQQTEDFDALQAWMSKHSGAVVLIFSNDFSQNFLLQVMRHGVREVLPVDAAEMDLEHAYERIFSYANKPLVNSKREMRQQKTVSFLPCKGGSGATLLACNLGFYLSQDNKRRIAFIDLDLHTGDATFYLCNDSQKNSLSDLTYQIDRLDEHLFNSSLHAVSGNYQLLAAPVSAEHALTMTPDHIDRVMALARQNFDFVLVDLNPALSALTLKALDNSDVICIVMDFSIMHLRDAKRLLNLLLSLGYSRDKFRVIGVDHGNADEINLKKIEEGLGLPLILTVPEAKNAANAACDQGLPLSKVSGSHEVMSAIQKLANLLFSIPVHKSSRWLANWF